MMTKTSTHLALFLAATSLVACGGSPTEPDDSTTTASQELVRKSTRTVAPAPVVAPAVTFAVDVTNTAGVVTPGAPAPTYVILNTNTVYFATEINGTFSGHHLASVYALMPSGAAYQRIDLSFATDVAAAVGEQQAEKTATGWRVWSSMPCAGTVIEQTHLTGVWTSELWMDSASTATARSNFTLSE